MGSKGRVPPLIRRPLPGPGMMHPDHFGPGIRPPPGPFPPFDRLPPPEVLGQNISVQNMELQRIAAENQRLATTQVALRQELAAAQKELQRLHGQVGAMKHEKEQQMRSLLDKMAKMADDLQAAEPIKMEVQQARADAQKLIAEREELFTKVQHLTQDYQRIHSDVQQIPALMSELEALRQEYQHCRATYDYEKKLYNDHCESLQVMEENYISMVRELEKLRAELANAPNVEWRAGAAYMDQNAATPYVSTGYKGSEVAGHPSLGQNTYEDGYNASQGRGALHTAAYSGGPAGSVPARAGYDTARGPGYAVSRGPGYEASRESGYEGTKVHGYDAPPRSAGGSQGLVAAHGNAMPYGSPTPPNLAAGGYDAQFKGGNPATLPNFAGSGYESQPRGGNPPTPPNLVGGGYGTQYRGGNPVRR